MFTNSEKKKITPKVKVDTKPPAITKPQPIQPIKPKSTTTAPSFGFGNTVEGMSKLGITVAITFVGFILINFLNNFWALEP